MSLKDSFQTWFLLNLNIFSLCQLQILSKRTDFGLKRWQTTFTVRLSVWIQFFPKFWYSWYLSIHRPDDSSTLWCPSSGISPSSPVWLCNIWLPNDCAKLDRRDPRRAPSRSHHHRISNRLYQQIERKMGLLGSRHQVGLVGTWPDELKNKANPFKLSGLNRIANIQLDKFFPR